VIISQGIKENGLKQTRGKSLIVSCLGAAFPVDPYFFYRHGSDGILTVGLVSSGLFDDLAGVCESASPQNC